MGSIVASLLHMTSRKHSAETFRMCEFQYSRQLYQLLRVIAFTTNVFLYIGRSWLRIEQSDFCIAFVSNQSKVLSLDLSVLFTFRSIPFTPLHDEIVSQTNVGSTSLQQKVESSFVFVIFRVIDQVVMTSMLRTYQPTLQSQC